MVKDFKPGDKLALTQEGIGIARLASYSITQEGSLDLDYGEDDPILLLLSRQPKTAEVLLHTLRMEEIELRKRLGILIRSGSIKREE